MKNFRKNFLKNIIYFVLFSSFFLFNFLLIYQIHQKKQQSLRTNKFLAEIEKTNLESQFYNSTAPLILGEYTSQLYTDDSRSANLKSFFRKHNSPLYEEAEYIVEISDKYKFDYRLLPAIAMQESNLCKFIPDDSYNCWGWGIYGDKVTKFESYKEAIETVAQGLKKEYIDKGYVTASSIMEKYTPSSAGSWAHGVNTFLKLLQ